MSRRIDRRVGKTAPVRDEDVRRLSLDGEAELLQGIVGESRGADDGVTVTPTTRRSTRARRIGLTLAATAAVGAFALVGVSLTGDSGSGRAWAAAALRVADAVPRLAIGGDDDGWVVTRADQFQVDDGEMSFENGTLRADLTWRAAATHADYVADRAHGSERLPDVVVAGATAEVFKYRDTGAVDDYTALWRIGRYSLELRMNARGLPRAQFVATLRALRLVSVDAWLSAMPASVVKPADRETTVRGMLAGLPLPDGFDTGELTEGDGVNDRYQLGAQVSGAVACAWIEQWASARRDGDAAGERAAADALATSRRWPILNEMKADGAYPEVVWDLADGVNGSGRVMGGKGMPVEVAAPEALGCARPIDETVPADRRRRFVDDALRGVPLPGGFDPAVIVGREDLRDRYELGRGVVNAVACAWLDQWVGARRAGDSAAAAAAARALGSATGWQVVRDIPSGGDFPTTLFEFADGVRGDGTVFDGRPIEDAYSPAFGCSGF